MTKGNSLVIPRKSRRAVGASAEAAKLDLTLRAKAGTLFVPYLRRKLKLAHAILRPALRELSLALVNDSQMSALHRDYMNISGPTDVLTFPLEEGESGMALSGEVVICVPHARRASRENEVNIREELLLYALHGMLHLCGFDDRTEREFRRMHRTEDTILTQLGVGPVFNVSSRSVLERKTRGGR